MRWWWVLGALMLAPVVARAEFAVGDEVLYDNEEVITVRGPDGGTLKLGHHVVWIDEVVAVKGREKSVVRRLFLQARLWDPPATAAVELPLAAVVLELAGPDRTLLSGRPADLTPLLGGEAPAFLFDPLHFTDSDFNAGILTPAEAQRFFGPGKTITVATTRDGTSGYKLRVDITAELSGAELKIESARGTASLDATAKLVTKVELAGPIKAGADTVGDFRKVLTVRRLARPVLAKIVDQPADVVIGTNPLVKALLKPTKIADLIAAHPKDGGLGKANGQPDFTRNPRQLGFERGLLFHMARVGSDVQGVTYAGAGFDPDLKAWDQQPGLNAEEKQVFHLKLGEPLTEAVKAAGDTTARVATDTMTFLGYRVTAGGVPLFVDLLGRGDKLVAIVVRKPG